MTCSQRNFKRFKITANHVTWSHQWQHYAERCHNDRRPTTTSTLPDFSAHCVSVWQTLESTWENIDSVFLKAPQTRESGLKAQECFVLAAGERRENFGACPIPGTLLRSSSYSPSPAQSRRQRERRWKRSARINENVVRWSDPWSDPWSFIADDMAGRLERREEWELAQAILHRISCVEMEMQTRIISPFALRCNGRISALGQTTNDSEIWKHSMRPRDVLIYWRRIMTFGPRQTAPWRHGRHGMRLIHFSYKAVAKKETFFCTKGAHK